MKLVIKEKIISWFGSFDVYDEKGDIEFRVKGKPAMGYKFIIYNKNGEDVGVVKEKRFTFVPTFKIYKNGKLVGKIKKSVTIFKPKFKLSLGGYKIVGDPWAVSFNIAKQGTPVATIQRKILATSSTFLIDANEEDVLNVLMITLAIHVDESRKTDVWYDWSR